MASQVRLYVPSYITANASKFKLHFPQIAGTIPVEFGQLVNLQELVLWKNKLTGAIVCPIIHAFVRFADIPPFCAGEVPKELGNLVNLTILYLSGNQFRGELYFPYYICNLVMHIIISLRVFAQ